LGVTAVMRSPATATVMSDCGACMPSIRVTCSMTTSAAPALPAVSNSASNPGASRSLCFISNLPWRPDRVTQARAHRRPPRQAAAATRATPGGCVPTPLLRACPLCHIASLLQGRDSPPASPAIRESEHEHTPSPVQRGAVAARCGNRRRQHPRGRSHRAARAGHADHTAATTVRTIEVLYTRGNFALRHARTGLVLEQHLLRRTYRNALRRTGTLGDG